MTNFRIYLRRFFVFHRKEREREIKKERERERGKRNEEGETIGNEITPPREHVGVIISLFSITFYEKVLKIAIFRQAVLSPLYAILGVTSTPIGCALTLCP
eukprot:sb/3478443/